MHDLHAGHPKCSQGASGKSGCKNVQFTCSRRAGLPRRQLAGCVQGHVEAALLAAQLQGAHQPLRGDDAQTCGQAPVLSGTKAFHLRRKRQATQTNREHKADIAL